MNLKIMDSKPTKAQQDNSVDTIQTTERIFECKAFGHEWIIRIVPVFWFIMSLIITLTTCLGLWQLDRMHQKASTLNTTKALTSHQVSGHLRPPLIYLDNITHNGRAGYEIIAQFKPTQAASDLPSLILVNLGWVAAPHLRSQLPEVTLNSTALSTLNLEPSYWSQRTPSINIDTFEHTNTFRIQAMNSEVQQTLNLPEHYFRALSGDGVLITEHWQQQNSHLEMAPKRHLGYAIQWFSMAFIALVILVVSSVSIVRPYHGDDEHA